MNDQSICARWRTLHWECNVLDSLLDPRYFNPPVPPVGEAIRTVTAFHASMPRAGFVFERAALGGHWTRTS